MPDNMDTSSAVVGIVGLSLQLGKTIKDVCDLLDSIKDAPKDLATLKRELGIIESIMNRISHNEQLYAAGGESDEMIQNLHPILEQFREPLNDLSLIAAEISSGLDSRSKIRRQCAKVDWTWRAEKIAKLKIQLHDAKFNILIVQTSQAPCSNSFQPARMPGVSTLACRQRFPSSGTRISTALDQDTLLPLPAISPRTYQTVSASTISLEQAGTEITVDEAIQPAAVVTHLESSSDAERGTDHATRATTTAQLIQRRLIDNGEAYINSCDSRSMVRRRQAGHPRSKTIRTRLGEVHYLVTTYRVVHPWNLGAKDPGIGTQEKVERKLSCRFIPHQWVAKLGMKRALEMNSLGWQAKLCVYKMRPNSSAIFEYCRRGDIDAVRLMLKCGKASVYDINELGETPLHIAASWCQTEICTLLLEVGADRSKTDLRRDPKTPFHRACCPGEVDMPDIPYQKQMSTLRLFITHGEDLNNVSCLYALMDYESRYGDAQELQIPSRWIIDDVLPSLDPYSHDTKWWQVFLLAALRMTRPHPCFSQIIRCCAKPAVRVDFLYWIFSLQQEHHPFRDRASMKEEFECLSKYSGGVSFLQSFNGRIYSPLSAAMRSGLSFIKFRSLVQRSPYDPRDVIRSELQLWDQGWTEETLISLFEATFTPFSRAGFSDCRLGNHCANSLQCHWDYPFQKVVRRFKEKIDQRAPPDDEETLCEMAWHEVLGAYDAGICWNCFAKRGKGRWPFLPNGPRYRAEEIKIFKHG